MLGRRGVGRGAVSGALASAGVALTVDEADADVQVLVVAEALKPEERARLRGLPGAGAQLVVLNKADLAGPCTDGPLAHARRRAAELAVTVGRPVVPMIAPLATVGLDDADVAALRVLVTVPADLTSTDSFVATDHQLSAEVRARLLDKLDRFGLAHAIRAIADGATGATVTRQLRALSQVDGVVEQLGTVAAPLRYRRVRCAVRELRALAAQSGDDKLNSFLISDAVVVAVMAAAVEVVAASGFTVDGERGGDCEGEPDAELRRAIRWTAYAHGPVNRLHHSCAKDIVRGSLRLVARVP